MTKKQILEKIGEMPELLNKIEKILNFEEQDWILKNGNTVKIIDLSIDHLKNIIKKLQRKYDAIENPLNDYPSFQGEMAQMYAEQQWHEQMHLYNKLENLLRMFASYLAFRLL